MHFALNSGTNKETKENLKRWHTQTTLLLNRHDLSCNFFYFFVYFCTSLFCCCRLKKIFLRFHLQNITGFKEKLFFLCLFWTALTWFFFFFKTIDNTFFNLCSSLAIYWDFRYLCFFFNLNSCVTANICLIIF